MIKINTQQSCLENAIELKISAARRIMGKIDVKNMELYYSSFHALKNINLEIPEKKITAFIGPSGCGKSTLRVIM